MRLIEDFKKYVCQTSDAPMGLEIAKAEGPYLFTKSGERYLDLIAGIGVVNIGHGNPEVLAAIQKQASAYLHPMVYGEMAMAPQVHYAKLLAEVLPGDIDHVFFTNSGTEAVEGALKTARKFTGRTELFSYDSCYHGDTYGSMSLQSERQYRQPFDPGVLGIRHLPWNKATALDLITEKTAGVIIEPIQGEGGIRIPDAEYMHALRARCSKVGALLIFDEVMTGFGRTGKLFAAELWNIEPDIIVMAKALGGGMPLGAFAGPRRILQTLSQNPPLAHVTTFGGHPVCCAAGLASLQFILQEKLWERAVEIGQKYHDFFESMRKQTNRKSTKLIREVRSQGCLIGVEFVDHEKTQAFSTRCFDEKIIIGWTLFHSNIIRMAPPLILDEAQVSASIDTMKNVLLSLED